MTKRIYTLLVLLFCVTFTFAQSSLDVPSYEGSTGFQDEEKADMSDNYFPPKPKHGTEIGLSLGHHFIHGDVYARPGWGVGLHVRRAFNYTMSWRVQGVYGNSTGLDSRQSTFGISGIQTAVSTWDTPYDAEDRLYRNYKTTSGWLSGHFIANLSNVLFHKKSNKWNLYVFAGPSLFYYKGKTNILNGDGGIYTNAQGNPGMQIAPGGIEGNNEYFNRDKVKFIKNDILDDSYETEFVYGNGSSDDDDGPRGFTNFNLLGKRGFALIPSVDVGAGLARKITNRINVAIEHQAMISINDNLDGHDVSRHVDVPHFTSLKINFNLNPKEGVEPLYWVNPLVSPIEDIARLKRDKVELKDTDGDGVLDNFDEEADTPEGCPVDTKGRRLDSDGDGVFDCEDEEPYTPYNLISGVDSKGVSPEEPEVPAGLTRDQIIALGKEKNWGASVTNVTQGGGVRTGCGDWFLPMIHFDLDKYALKPEAKAQLHHIAQVMKQCPETCIVAVGHTDRLNNNAYNQTLSYNRARTAVDYLVQVYGISPSRLKVNYGGEETPLVDTNSSSYINRRVEFRVCNGEVDMGSPSGSAGSGSSSGFGTSGSAPVKY